MKNIFFMAWVSFFSINNLSAQNVTGTVIGTNFNYERISDSEHLFHFETAFSSGSTGACFNFEECTFSSIGDTFYVQAHYNIVGVWPQQGCVRSDSVSYNQLLPQDIDYIKMSTNVTAESDTPPYNPVTVEDVYFRLIDLNNLAVNTNAIQQAIMAPNPTTGQFTITAVIKLDAIKIYDILGKVIQSIIPDAATTSIDLNNYSAGIYFVKMISDHDETIKKIIVR